MRTFSSSVHTWFIPARDGVPVTRPRISLYGHDSLGLGHLRRNLCLARTLSGLPDEPDVLIVSGAVEASSYDLPAGAEMVTIPGVRKDDAGCYRSRRLRVGLDEAIALRRDMLTATLGAYAPDLLVVDKSPRGFGGELGPALDALRARGTTRVVLGLRDVLDEPGVARREWREASMNESIRSHVDEVWIYGDPSVHDLAEACGIPPALRTKIRYTGYLAAGRITAVERPPSVSPGVPYVLCTVGGGQDGVTLATAFLEARLPAGTAGVVVTGSQMAPRARQAVERVAAGRNGVTVVTFHPSVDRWMPGAAAMVTMGGYNTVAEILSTDVPALVVPRRSPRAEQAHRAAALAALGLVDVIDGPLAPAALTQWLDVATSRPRAARLGIDLGGLSGVARLATRLLDHRRLRAVAV